MMYKINHYLFLSKSPRAGIVLTPPIPSNGRFFVSFISSPFASLPSGSFSPPVLCPGDVSFISSPSDDAYWSRLPFPSLSGPLPFLNHSFLVSSPFFAGYLFIHFCSAGILTVGSLRLMLGRFSFSLFFTLSAYQVGLNSLESLYTL